MADLKLSAFSDEYADGFTEQLEGMRRFGIEYIELRHADKKNVSVLTASEVAEIKQKTDFYGIGVSAIGSPLGKIALDGDMDAHLETARRIFETANILKAKYVRMFSFYAPSGKEIADMRGEVLDALEKLVLLARTHGVTLCHENEAKIYGDTPVRCRELLDYFGGELKCVFDMGNFVLEHVDPYPAYELLKKDIAYFHIKDAFVAGAIVPPGKGEAKIAEIFKKFLGEDALAAKEFDILLGKFQLLDIFDHLRKACGNRKATPIGALAEKHIKIADTILIPFLKVSVTHGKLIEIAKHR